MNRDCRGLVAVRLSTLKQQGWAEQPRESMPGVRRHVQTLALPQLCGHWQERVPESPFPSPVKGQRGYPLFWAGPQSVRVTHLCLALLGVAQVGCTFALVSHAVRRKCFQSPLLTDDVQRAGSPHWPWHTTSPSVSLHRQAVTQCHPFASSPHPHPKGPLPLRPSLPPWRSAHASSPLLVCPPHPRALQQGCQI